MLTKRRVIQRGRRGCVNSTFSRRSHDGEVGGLRVENARSRRNEEIRGGSALRYPRENKVDFASRSIRVCFAELSCGFLFCGDVRLRLRTCQSGRVRPALDHCARNNKFFVALEPERNFEGDRSFLGRRSSFPNEGQSLSSPE